MKISHDFPQFTDERALFVVAGAEDFELYVASNGIIERIVFYQSEDEVAFDEERTLSKQRSKGRVWGAISMDKDNELREDLERDTLEALEEKLSKVGHAESFDKVILFAPDYQLPKIEKAIPAVLRPSLHLAVKGNHVGAHPFDILALAKEEPQDKTKRY